MPAFSPIFIIINIISITIGLLIIFVNALTIFLIFRKEREWENTVYFIANLAVSDGVTGALIVANVVFNLNQHHIFYECIFRLATMNSAIFASVYILLGVRCDRYIKIVLPLRYTTFLSEAVVKTYLCSIWTISAILIVTPYLHWINDVIVDNVCSYFVVLKQQFLLGICFTIFCALMLQFFMYIHIFVIAVTQGWKSEVRTLDQARSQLPKRALFNHMVKPSRALFIMVGVNFLTLLPVGIYVYLVTTQQLNYMDHYTQGDVLIYVATPLYLNSLINPFLYAFKIPDIRRTLSQALPWLRHSARVGPPQSSNRSGVPMTTNQTNYLSIIEIQ